MKYLFYISKKYSIPIVAPLVAELKKRKGNYAFYVSDKVKKSAPKDWENIYTNLKDAKKFSPDFVLCPGNFVDFRMPGVKVQIFHGLGIEKPVHYKIRHFFDIFLTSGPYVTERFKKLKQKYKYFDIIETGWPKVDYIVNYPNKDLKAKYKIPAEKKVILYAPTFSSKMESLSDLVDTIPKIIRKDEFWLFKFHEFMDQDLVNELVKNLPANTKLVKKFDITPFLHIADIMLSDTSSVIYEFLTLNKPIITYKTISRKDKGINITDPKLLRESIDRYLENPNLDKNNRKKNIAEINPNTKGKICENIFDELDEINPKNYPKKGKPLNLFRKWQIIYHSIFRKGYLR